MWRKSIGNEGWDSIEVPKQSHRHARRSVNSGLVWQWVQAAETAQEEWRREAARRLASRLQRADSEDSATLAVALYLTSAELAVGSRVCVQSLCVPELGQNIMRYSTRFVNVFDASSATMSVGSVLHRMRALGGRSRIRYDTLDDNERCLRTHLIVCDMNQ